MDLVSLVAAGDQLKYAVSLGTITDFSGFVGNVLEDFTTPENTNTS